MSDRRALALFLLACLAAACDEKTQTPAPDTSSPQVIITSPADSATIVGPDSIRIEASDDEGVVRVAAYLDADSLGADLTPPYAIAFNPIRMGADTFALRASAWDAAGNRGESDPVTVFVAEVAAIDTLAPQVVISEPLDGAAVDDLTIVEVTATDDDSVALVRVTCDDTLVGEDALPPYQVLWHPEAWADGELHFLVASAEDPAGNRGESATVSVRVYPSSFMPPELLGPAEDSVAVAPSAITFTWRRHAVAPDYQLQLAREDAFAALLWNEVLADTSLTITAPEYGLHYWRLRAGWSQGSWSAWTTPRALQAGLRFAGTDLDLEESIAAGAAADAPDGGLLLSGTTRDRLLLFAVDAAGDPLWARNAFTGQDLRAALDLRALPAGGWLLHALSAQGRCIARLDPSAALLDCAPLPPHDVAASDALPIGESGWAEVAVQGGPGSDYSSTFISCKRSAADSPWYVAARGDYLEGNTSGFRRSYAGTALATMEDSLLVMIGDYSYSAWDDLGSSLSLRTWLEAWRLDDGEFAWRRFIDDFDTVDAALPRPGGGWIAVGKAETADCALLIVEPDYEQYSIAAVAADPLSGAELLQLSSGDLVVAGYRGTYEAWLMRIALDGSLIWEIPLGAVGTHARPRALLADEDDRIAVVSRVIWTDAGMDLLRLQRFDAAGNEVAP